MDPELKYLLQVGLVWGMVGLVIGFMFGSIFGAHFPELVKP